MPDQPWRQTRIMRRQAASVKQAMPRSVTCVAGSCPYFIVCTPVGGNLRLSSGIGVVDGQRVTPRSPLQRLLL